jgi:hypothetical protein
LNLARLPISPQRHLFNTVIILRLYKYENLFYVSMTGFEPARSLRAQPSQDCVATFTPHGHLERNPGFKPSPSAWKAESSLRRNPAFTYIISSLFLLTVWI